MRERILIIEDDDRILQFIRRGLTYEGYQVETAEDGPSGLASARDIPPDLVVLDWMLPGMDGLEVCRRLRAAGDTPVLMLTAKDSVPLKLDTGTHLASRGDRSIELTAKEYELLELFLRHPRQVLTRDVIYDRVWGYDFGGESNIIEVYVRYIRQKTEEIGEPRLIHTVRGVGYVLRETN
jgi:two-component system response regulator MprA